MLSHATPFSDVSTTRPRLAQATIAPPRSSHHQRVFDSGGSVAMTWRYDVPVLTNSGLTTELKAAAPVASSSVPLRITTASMVVSQHYAVRGIEGTCRF